MVIVSEESEVEVSRTKTGVAVRAPKMRLRTRAWHECWQLERPRSNRRDMSALLLVKELD